MDIEPDRRFDFSKPDKPLKEPELIKTPVDEFNLHILKSKDWGKTNANSGFLPLIKTSMKPDEKAIRGALGFKSKNPRERILKKAREEAKNHESLGPPMIGKTFGHGIVYSPEKLV